MAITNKGVLEGPGSTDGALHRHAYRPAACDHAISWVYHDGKDDEESHGFHGWHMRHAEDASILSVVYGEPESQWRLTMRDWISYLHGDESPRGRAGAEGSEKEKGEG